MTTPPASPRPSDSQGFSLSGPPGVRVQAVPANVTRFLLLSELCRELGERGCTSYLVNPASGSAVRRVDRPAPSRDKIDIAAVERPDGWVYAWDGRWARTCHLDQVAHHIARMVAA